MQQQKKKEMIGRRSSRRTLWVAETQDQTLNSCCIILHLKLMNLNELDELEEHQLMGTFTATFFFVEKKK
jgi:hypothetical protein